MKWVQKSDYCHEALDTCKSEVKQLIINILQYDIAGLIRHKHRTKIPIKDPYVIHQRCGNV